MLNLRQKRRKIFTRLGNSPYLFYKTIVTVPTFKERKREAKTKGRDGEQGGPRVIGIVTDQKVEEDATSDVRPLESSWPNYKARATRKRGSLLGKKCEEGTNAK